MEQWVWIIWIANLRRGAWSGTGFHPTIVTKRTADALDIDVIENHLAKLKVIGKGGKLGLDFGWNTDDSDENKAVVAAYKMVYPKKRCHSRAGSGIRRADRDIAYDPCISPRTYPSANAMPAHHPPSHSMSGV